MIIFKNNSKLIQLLIVLFSFFALYIIIEPSTNSFFWRIPETFLPATIFWGSEISFWQLPSLINDGLDYLMEEFIPIQVYIPVDEEYEQSTLLLEVARTFSSTILFCINVIRELFLGGVKTIVTFTSWDYISENSWAYWPALPWTVVTISAAMLGYVLKGRGLALLVTISLVFISTFGQWEPAMETLSFVLIAAPFSFLLGITLGISAYKSKVVDAVLTPLLNVAQTMPHFSYLVPVVILFGIGDHAGAIATIIFATPPMVRLTKLGLQKVSPEIIESGLMSGCTKVQLLFKVLLPSAKRDILIGVNQVIMQCLAMAVIASFIGAKGLGFNLLVALNQLRIGLALELGVCIVLIAVVLDKLSLAWADKQSIYTFNTSLLYRYKYSLLLGTILIVGVILAFIGSMIFKNGINYLYLVPHNKGFSTENFWQAGVDWIVDNLYQTLKGFNYFLIQDVLIPMKEAFLGMPVIATFTLLAGIAYIIGGLRSFLIVSSFLMFIALTEWWDRALITAYMTTFAVIVSIIIGTTVGFLCSRNEKATKLILLVCDTFQTFPSFIYLIPVIMLFGVTDTSVLIAVIVYATIPATRYTVEGLRNVPINLHEAGSMSGVNSWQRLTKIELPIAFPHIMLGVNQTIMFALFMVIIGAFIGTDDLGQYILKSLSDEKGMGNGLMLGLCVAFIGLTFDHIISKWSQKRKIELGLN